LQTKRDGKAAEIAAHHSLSSADINPNRTWFFG
jgi:hypothetical protein